jgi:adenylate cyclase
MRFKLHIPRTLRVSILTIFLILISLTLIIASSYAYIRNYKSILTFSIGTISRVNAMATQKLKCLQTDLDETVQITSALIRDPSTINLQNETFIRYGLTLLKAYPYLTSVYVGSESGDLLRLIQLARLSETTYFSDPNKPLPKQAIYAIQGVDREGNISVNKMQYCDENFQVLSEEILPDSFDPRTRPWYERVKQTKKIYWTDPYRYIYTDENGISVAYPITSNGTFIGVAGIDLSFDTLANFLTSLKIGKTGIACIIDNTGNLIEPKNTPFKSLIQKAFIEFSKIELDKLTFEYEGVKYLAGFELLPEEFEKGWYLVVIIPIGDFFDELLQTQKEIFFASLIILIISSIMIYYFAKRISSPIVEISKEINKITHLDFSNEHKRIKSKILEIKMLDEATAALSSAMRSFEKYLPKEVVRLLLSRGREIELGGEKKEITILFTDIQDFTTIAEALPTEELMSLLGEYFDLLSKIILEHQGTIDKYIGDSIMAFWGAPIENKDHALLACKAALACQEAVIKLNEKRKEKGQPEFFTRIGITTGVAIVGNIGTEKRMNYTVIGDIVNTASRFQNINKIYHTSIIISEALREKIQGAFLTRPLDVIEVKGKMIQVPIFELVGVHGKSDESLYRRFQEAYEAYQQQDKKRALALFEEIHQNFPEDYPTQFYLERLKKE